MPRGRPRLLRPEGLSVTASPELQGVSTTNDTSGNGVTLTMKNDEKKPSKKILPYHGKSSLEVNIPRFMVNGRKLIRIVKKLRESDKDGNPVYTIQRTLHATIFDKRPEGKALRKQLKAMEIPGA